MSFNILFLGFGQGAVVPQTAGEEGAGLLSSSSTVPPPSFAAIVSEKPITLPPPVLAPSGRNIISNVYFPIEKLNKNLISTNDSPTSSGGGSSSSSNSYNNNNLRHRPQGQKVAVLNDLRPESDLINSPGDQQPPSSPISSSIKRLSAVEREATNVTAQLNNHAYLNCKVINSRT